MSSCCKYIWGVPSKSREETLGGGRRQHYTILCSLIFFYKNTFMCYLCEFLITHSKPYEEYCAEVQAWWLTCDPNILETEAKVASNKASLGYIVRPVKTNRKPPIFSSKSENEVCVSPTPSTLISCINKVWYWAICWQTTTAD